MCRLLSTTLWLLRFVFARLTPVCCRRKGKLGADQFLSSFRHLCGRSDEADAVLEQLASLLPAAEQQLALTAALEAERGSAGMQQAGERASSQDRLAELLDADGSVAVGSSRRACYRDAVILAGRHLCNQCSHVFSDILMIIFNCLQACRSSEAPCSSSPCQLSRRLAMAMATLRTVAQRA